MPDYMVQLNGEEGARHFEGFSSKVLDCGVLQMTRTGKRHAEAYFSSGVWIYCIRYDADEVEADGAGPATVHLMPKPVDADGREEPIVEVERYAKNAETRRSAALQDSIDETVNAVDAVIAEKQALALEEERFVPVAPPDSSGDWTGKTERAGGDLTEQEKADAIDSMGKSAVAAQVTQDEADMGKPDPLVQRTDLRPTLDAVVEPDGSMTVTVDLKRKAPPIEAELYAEPEDKSGWKNRFKPEAKETDGDV